MITLRQIVPALCLATALAGDSAAYAATADAPDDESAAGAVRSRPTWQHGHRRRHGWQMGFVLHKLEPDARSRRRRSRRSSPSKRASSRRCARALKANRAGSRGHPADRHAAMRPRQDGAEQCRHAHHARERDLEQDLPARADDGRSSKRSPGSSPQHRRRAQSKIDALEGRASAEALVEPPRCAGRAGYRWVAPMPSFLSRSMTLSRPTR